MIEFGKREAGAAAAIAAVAVVGGIGWSVQQQRQQATVEDLKPTFADGTPAKTAGPDGTVEISAVGPEETLATPEPAALDASGETPPAAGKSGQIVVFVSGAVKRPGVYTFKPGARIYHAVRAAGGFKANAQQDALNQAETLRDADQIYIPPRSKAANAGGAVSVASSGGRLRPEMFQSSGSRRVSFPPPAVTVRPLIIEGTSPSSAKSGEPGETTAPRERGRVLGKPPAETVKVATVSSEPAPTEGMAAAETEFSAATEPEPAKTSGRSRGGSGGATTKFKNPGDGLVNINTAGAAELQKLPGVGPSTAQKFIEYRTQIGRFADISQVQDIKGIGPKKFAKLRPFITL